MTTSSIKANYIKGRSLGEGTWGEVYQASREHDNLQVAIKRFKPRDMHNGINFTAIREVKYLKNLNSPYVIKVIGLMWHLDHDDYKFLVMRQLEDVFFRDNALHMVLELCPTDLSKVIKDKDIALITQDHCKAYMLMLLKGMEHLHERFILHRDLKPENLLIGMDGNIKIADFGLAKDYGSPNILTSNVCTLWYKAPELIFGANHYSAAIDNWSIGCIFADLLWRTPLFPGTNDVEQLQKIFHVLGTPNPEDWPGAELLPKYIEFQKTEPISLLPLFRQPTPVEQSTDGLPSSLDLLLKFLALNPSKRITASKALEHPYFQQLPAPAAPHELPLPEKVKHLMRFTNDKVPSTEPLPKKARKS